MDLVLQVREVRDQSQQKAEVSPFIAELLRLEEQAKQQGVGRWTKVSPISAFKFLEDCLLAIPDFDLVSTCILNVFRKRKLYVLNQLIYVSSKASLLVFLYY